MQGGPIIAYQEAAARAGKQLAARREPAARPAFPSRPHPRAGGPRDQADLRRACEDVRTAGVCPRADPGAGRGGRAARRLGRGRRADCRALYEIGLVVRRHPAAARRIAEGLRREATPAWSTSACRARSAPRRRRCSNNSNGSPKRSCRRFGRRGAEVRPPRGILARRIFRVDDGFASLLRSGLANLRRTSWKLCRSEGSPTTAR